MTMSQLVPSQLFQDSNVHLKSSSLSQPLQTTFCAISSNRPSAAAYPSGFNFTVPGPSTSTCPPAAPMSMQASASLPACSNLQQQQLQQPLLQEEITTIFVVGFPDDMQEREFQNMFLFSEGFEAATLKIPLFNPCSTTPVTIDDEQQQVGGGGGCGPASTPIRKQIIGFAKFKSRKAALNAMEVISGHKIDQDKQCMLKAELAKKNLHTKKCTASTSGSAGQSFQSGSLMGPYFGYGGGLSHLGRGDFRPFVPPQFQDGAYYEDENVDAQYYPLPDMPHLFYQHSLSEFAEPYQSPSSGGIESIAKTCVSKVLDKESAPGAVMATPETVVSTEPLRASASLRKVSVKSSPNNGFESVLFQNLENFSGGPKNAVLPTLNLSTFVTTPSSNVPIYNKSVIQPPSHFNNLLAGPTPPYTPPALFQPLPKPVLNDQNNPPCNTLYVGNLPASTSEQELRDLFSQCEGYRRLCFRMKPNNGPMCFVEFETVSYAKIAMTCMFGYMLSNSTKGGIRLSFSKNPLGVRSFNSSWGDLKEQSQFHNTYQEE